MLSPSSLEQVGGAYLSVASGKVTLLNSQVMIGGGVAVILQVSRATDPFITVIDIGCWVKVDKPAENINIFTIYETQHILTPRISVVT